MKEVYQRTVREFHLKMDKPTFLEFSLITFDFKML